MRSNRPSSSKRNHDKGKQGGCRAHSSLPERKSFESGTPGGSAVPSSASNQRRQLLCETHFV